MSKDYARWHEEKTRVNGARGVALFQEREIWWCALGENIGSEQDGGSERFTHPVAILTKFNLELCLVVPLTGRRKHGRYYFPIGEVEGQDATAILSQIRLIDRKRLQLKMATLPRAVFDDLTRRVVGACFPNLKP
jgi:mRNA-degrading endonuclease toxin of MazEF toxin-antitoxin module